MQPLSKYKILSFGQAWAAPYAEMMLADMGADVIKVEPPGIGDHVRKWSRGDLQGLSPHLLAVNRNKRGIVIDLKAPQGKALALELIAKSDAVFENFSPGTMTKLGLDYASVREANPRLVYCSVSGYGNTGPYARRPAYDMIMQGEGSYISVTGTEDGQVAKLGVPVLDVMTAMVAGYSTLCALLERDTTGKGQYLDISMLETAASSQAFNLISYSLTGEEPKPMGTAHPMLAPYQVYSTQSTPISIAILTDVHWQIFCKVIERADLADSSLFATAMSRIDHRELLNTELVPVFLSHGAEYWLHELDRVGLVCGAVNDIAALLQHPQLKARQFFYDWTMPTGKVAVPGMPWRTDNRGEAVQRMPPELGEHTDEVLTEWLQMGHSDLDRLKQAGAIFSAS